MTSTAIGEQFQAFWNAPIPVLLLLALLAVALWKVKAWNDKGVHDALNERLRFKDDQLAQLREKLVTRLRTY